MDKRLHATLTIGIPTFNRRAQLVRLLDSLLPLRDAIEGGTVRLYVSDNASSDDTPDAVRGHPLGPTLTYWRQPANLGVHGNVLHLMRSFESEYLLLVGDDDVVVPDGLRATLALLADRRPSWCLVNIRNMDGRPVLRHLPVNAAVEGPVIDRVGFSGLNNEMGYFGCCVLSRAAAQAACAARESGALCLADQWPSVHLFFFLLSQGGGLISTWSPVQIVADAGRWDVAVWYTMSRADIGDIVKLHESRGVIDAATSARIRRQLLDTSTERQLLALGVVFARDPAVMKIAVRRILRGHADVLSARQRICCRWALEFPAAATRMLRPLGVAGYRLLYRTIYIDLLNQLRATPKPDQLRAFM